MVEQKKPVAYDIAKKMHEIVTGVLATGNWESSEFLKAAAVKLRSLVGQIEQLIKFIEQNQQIENIVDVAASVARLSAIVPGYCRVFVLLYQVENANLQGWHRAIKILVDHSVSKPVYKDENYIKEFIHSKEVGIEHNGYVVVNVKNDAFYEREKPVVDSCGHELFMLKENAIKLENIVELVLANGLHYAVCNDKLILL
jgi:hypothetical protein